MERKKSVRSQPDGLASSKIDSIPRLSTYSVRFSSSEDYQTGTMILGNRRYQPHPKPSNYQKALIKRFLVFPTPRTPRKTDFRPPRDRLAAVDHDRTHKCRFGAKNYARSDFEKMVSSGSDHIGQRGNFVNAGHVDLRIQSSLKRGQGFVLPGHECGPKWPYLNFDRLRTSGSGKRFSYEEFKREKSTTISSDNFKSFQVRNRSCLELYNFGAKHDIHEKNIIKENEKIENYHQVKKRNLKKNDAGSQLIGKRQFFENHLISKFVKAEMKNKTKNNVDSIFENQIEKNFEVYFNARKFSVREFKRVKSSLNSSF